MTEKTCNVCKASKPLTEFYTYKSGRHARLVYGHCKPCHRIMVDDSNVKKEERDLAALVCPHCQKKRGNI